MDYLKTIHQACLPPSIAKHLLVGKGGWLPLWMLMSLPAISTRCLSPPSPTSTAGSTVSIFLSPMYHPLVHSQLTVLISYYLALYSPHVSSFFLYLSVLYTLLFYPSSLFLFIPTFCVSKVRENSTSVHKLNVPDCNIIIFPLFWDGNCLTNLPLNSCK